jgi:hypothetical protein
MAALTANMTLPPRHVGGSPDLSFEYPANATDEYYVGAIVCESAGATVGRVVVDNADADTTLGINLSYVSAVADTLITVHVKGVWWIACANFETANIWGLFAPAAGSDNPADLDDLGAGLPSALGTLVHVGTTATDGYIDLDQRVVVANT